VRPADLIHDELVEFTLPGNGGRALAVLPTIPEDAPYRVREGIARRRITATTGRCPCGATVDYNAARAGGYAVAEVRHSSLCPADTARLCREIRRWAR
jgi:hypothetical protein